jgi:NAD+ kinase
MSEVRFRKIGLYCNRNKPQAMTLARSIYGRLNELGAEPMISREIEAQVGLPGKAADKADLCAQSDALVVLGGDGTLLWAARESYPYDIPILGVNLGYLGFLSETSTDNLDEQLQLLVRGAFFSSSRMTLWVQVLRGAGKEVVFESPAINEVHVFRQLKSRIVKLETYIDGDLVTHYRADGILVSTPTGSTGTRFPPGGRFSSRKCGRFLHHSGLPAYPGQPVDRRP